jgi:hypothetical protein
LSRDQAAELTRLTTEEDRVFERGGFLQERRKGGVVEEQVFPARPGRRGGAREAPLARGNY